jgi:hypothetical protein
MARIMNMDKVPYPVPASIVCDVDLERGLVVEIVGQADNNIWVDGADNEAYKVQLAGANSERGKILIHTSVPFSYDERDTERDFVLKAGEVGRGHYLNVGDEYTVAADLVSGDVAVGAEIGLAANGQYAVGGTVVIGEVTKVYTWNGQESVRIRIK